MGGVFALGMLALLVLFVCLTLFGVVCLVLALVFGLIYRGRAKKQKQGGDKVKTVWKVLPWAFLAAGLLAIYPAAWIAHDLRDPVSNLNDAVLHDDYDKAAALLESGVDPDGRAGSGADVLQYLLDNGCHADAQTHFGQNALDLIDQYEDDKQDAMRTLLMRYM